MRKTSFALALLTAAVLTACGGNGPRGGDQTPKTKFSSQITFGDSLSDVGTYAVGGVAALGGGQYTINGNNTSIAPELTGKNYTTLMAAQLGLPAPCAAQTGLQGTASAGFSVPVTDHPECFNYAQGGARVTNPIGPGNKALDKPGAISLGQMTVPVVTQIVNHLKKVNGKFKGDELVIVMSGGNDVLEQLGELSAAATAAGGQALAQSLVTQLAPGTTNPQTGVAAIGAAIQAEAAKPTATPQTIIAAAIGAAAQNGNTAAVANAATIGATAGAAATAAGTAYSTAHGPDLVKAMATAGAELGALVKTQLVANGANYVVVNNLPDVSISPSAKAQSADTQKLIQAMVATFNDQLKTAVAGESKVLYVDLAAISRDQATNPAPYGLTNTTTPACDLSPAKNPLGSSLVCNKNNLIAGDVSHYMFADSVHPTPFEYSLIARYMLEQMAVKGWL
ncbi:SGNH/GDSL hydrolase family protein [Massilia sp. LXY-6]|uniref:SGNH/GDSL hydrolase family protein n=1 Tax=Massilia sp. LXY-6 TaxID=3379823 RepID=UPI003EE422A3